MIVQKASHDAAYSHIADGAELAGRLMAKNLQRASRDAAYLHVADGAESAGRLPAKKETHVSKYQDQVKWTEMGACGPVKLVVDGEKGKSASASEQVGGCVGGGGKAAGVERRVPETLFPKSLEPREAHK